MGKDGRMRDRKGGQEYMKEWQERIGKGAREKEGQMKKNQGILCSLAKRAVRCFLPLALLYIIAIASDHDSDLAYIGLWGDKYPNGSISWEWIDGSSVNYTNFSPNAPLVNSSAYAVLMNMNDGTWWLSDPNENMDNNKTFHNAICMYESNE